jgi:hypothetical protein
LVARPDGERAARHSVLQQAEAGGRPIPFDERAARAFGQVAAQRRASGRKTTANAYDVLVAATACGRECPRRPVEEARKARSGSGRYVHEMTGLVDATSGRPATNGIPEARFTRLRRYNFVMGVLHAAQAVAVIALSTSFALPVTAAFMTGPPGSQAAAPATLFDVSIAWGCALFLLLSAAAHFIIASPPVFPWYRANLRLDRNYARWIEYSLSSSVMIVLIAMITGISDIAALVALFGVNVSMILFGLLQEKYEKPGGGMLPFWLGCIAGVTPWIAIGIYLVSPGNAASPPGFVYGIFVSLFVFFNCFALNQWLQYRRIGKWRDYLYGESVYITLSLVAKSLLAWQVFAGTLVPPS